jgi:hypothetical protein
MINIIMNFAKLLTSRKRILEHTDQYIKVEQQN